MQVTEGTSGNDTIIAGDDGGTASLNAGDVINGGAGTDTLKIFNAATGVSLDGIALTDIVA